MNRRILHVLGYLIPVIPVWRVARDVNKRFFVFIETPLVGVFITPLAVFAVQLLHGMTLQVDQAFVRRVVEVYLSYQLATIVRNGVNIEERLRPGEKIALNWMYTVVSYSVFTASDRLLSAQTERELLFAKLLVLFSVAWPIITQTLGTLVLTPFLFQRFPAREFLSRVTDAGWSAQEERVEQQGRLTELERLADGPDDSHVVSSKITVGKTIIAWLTIHDRVSLFSRRHIWRYWAIKGFANFAIAVTMIVLYYSLRWKLVGRTAESLGWLALFSPG